MVVEQTFTDRHRELESKRCHLVIIKEREFTEKEERERENEIE